MTKKDPFGERSCEQEIKILGGETYKKLYFDEAPFNEVAVDTDTYLIIGRRGSGKTALARYFSFQEKITNPLCIEVLKADAYEQVLSEISRRTSTTRGIAISHLRRVWEFVIWSLIINALEQDIPEEDKICKIERKNKSKLVADLIDYLMRLFNDEDDSTIGLSIERIVDNAELDRAKEIALKFAKKQPIIISIDTLEQYNIEDDALMNALAALVEYAAEFHLDYAPQNIFLKVFVSGEVFPHLKEAVLLNPLKTVKHPVYLFWRPRDLLRLIGWRLHYHLETNNLWDSKVKIDWEDENDVLEKIWVPHFGRTIQNANGINEQTWTYILRHTQLRPRQVILICNSIANLSIEARTFPTFNNNQIIEGVRNAELELASEILNSYSEIYKNVNQIVTSGLTTLSKVFQGNELDKRASQSAPEWREEYSPTKFRQLVAELGIIGRVTRNNHEDGYIDADFEYASTERLILTHRDLCVVHPMFYRKLNISINSKARVMPFTTPRGNYE